MLTMMTRLAADSTFNSCFLWFDDILVAMFKVVVG